MNTFIKSVIYFCISLMGFITIIEVVTNNIIQNKPNFVLKSKPKYIVVGHSMPEVAYNDSLISDFQNVSQSGETYFYNFFKIEQILKNNPSVKVVFVEYTNNNLSVSSIEKRTWGDNVLDYRYPRYAPYMSLSQKWWLFKNNPFGFTNGVIFNTEKNLRHIIKNKVLSREEIGRYLNLNGSKTDSLIAADSKLKDLNIKNKLTHNEKIPIFNLFYLRSIINLCHAKGVKVILIKSPIHKKSKDLWNEKKYNEILKTQFQDVEYLDLSKFPLSNNEFRDFEHLNALGAQKYSKFFNTLLDQNLLQIYDKQLFINQKINDYSE